MRHDWSYHRIYGHPEVVEDLVLSFVGQDWIDLFDFKRMERFNATFYAQIKQLKREGDIIYRLPYKDTDQSAYLLILLEFQSTPDKWMALRVNTYASLLYEQLKHEKKLTSKQLLPPIFPLVIYNGEARWQYPIALKKLIDLPRGSKLWPYQLSNRYHLIDEGQYRGKEPESINGAFIRLENSRTKEEAAVGLSKLFEYLDQHQWQNVKRDFVSWVNLVLNASRQLDLELPEAVMGSEVNHMLREKMARWSKESDDAIRQAQLEKQAAIEDAHQKDKVIEAMRKALREAGIDPDSINSAND